MRLIKRDGTEVTFNKNKIKNAILKANKDVTDKFKINSISASDIASSIEQECLNIGHVPNVEEIQDMVEDALIETGYTQLGKEYIKYRYDRSLHRKGNSTDKKMLSIIDCVNEEMIQENSNKNPTIASIQRDYLAGEVSRDLTERLFLPKEVVEAHHEGIIHFHDEDYFAQRIYNCCLINLEDMLQNGTVISQTYISKPHSFSTACNIATQIIAQVASSQYGGQSITLSHLAPFVQVSREKIREEVAQEFSAANVDINQEVFDSIVEQRVAKEIAKGIQTIQYQLITLMTTNGQAPFLSIFMWINEVDDPQTKSDLALIIAEVLKQRYKGVQNESQTWITPAFPKLLYVLDENNAKPGSEYYYLTELAAKCTARRLVPDYISAKVMRNLKLSTGETKGQGDVYPCMGCRSFLTPDRSEKGGYNNIAHVSNFSDKPKYYGRFNQGVVTINLPDVALSADGDEEKFWKILDERLELCHTALKCRHDRLMGTVSDAAPILWQNGAIARLKPGETIDQLLLNGYSTISLGYAGLYECTMAMKGVSHTDEENGGKEFATKVMQALNDACAKWKAEENIDYSVYGTPIETTTYKFAKCLQKRFGVIPGITDHGYITNSYHVNVREPIDAFAKLSFEAPFQELSPGGAISYVEVPNMQDNIEAVLAVIGYIYDNIMYAELNTKSDYCQVCGYDGEIQIVEDGDKLVWECPKCGNRDQSKLNVARRTCGYIGSQFWNQGRTEEIKDRVLHL